MPGSQLSLSATNVSKLKNTTGKPEWYHDRKVPGLSISVQPFNEKKKACKKTWYFVTKFKGEKIRHRIGTFPAVTPDAAAKAAKAKAGELAQGRDFRERERSGKLRICDLWKHWFETHCKPNKRTWKHDERDYNRFIKPAFQNDLIDSVQRSDIERLISGIVESNGKSPAHKARAILSAMYEQAIRNGWTDRNPVKGTHRPQYEPRQRYLKPDEVGKFFEAIEQLRSETARDYFKMLLWTGARRGNVSSMRWDELDLSTGLWVIPGSKHKSKKPQVIPLSPQAMEILNRRKAENFRASEYVFPGRGKKPYYTDPKDSWNKIKELSGIKNIRIHDLRRSLGAWMNNQGDSLRMIQQTLGHSNPAITATFYSPTEVEAIRKSMTNVADAMIGQGGE